MSLLYPDWFLAYLGVKKCLSPAIWVESAEKRCAVTACNKHRSQLLVFFAGIYLSIPRAVFEEKPRNLILPLAIKAKRKPETLIPPLAIANCPKC